MCGVRCYAKQANRGMKPEKETGNDPTAAHRTNRTNNQTNYGGGRCRLRPTLFDAFKQKSTGHLAKSLTATTLKQRLMMCAAILLSTFRLYAGLTSAVARRKDTREGRPLQHISCKRWYRSHVLVASSVLGCKAKTGCKKSAKAERRRLNVTQAAAAARFIRELLWWSCAEG